MHKENNEKDYCYFCKVAVLQCYALRFRNINHH